MSQTTPTGTGQPNTTLPIPRRFKVNRGETSIPCALWSPSETPAALVLACHGGGGHKESQAILAIAGQLLPRRIAVLAIDGPVHGERREDGNLDAGVARASFREAWRAGVGLTSLGEDFSATLDEAQRDPVIAALPVGYVGVSMGTAYGLPFLAQERRVKAAVLGLWSTTYAASEGLADFAKRVDCSVWFTQQWDDELFDRIGTAALFDAIGSEDKRLVAYPGPHRELEGERLSDAADYIAKRLTNAGA